ncbi:carboxypeptidase-like regulatory domain-containing protein [Pedobacter sp. ASV1-7]|uniref:STN domain-containing protein n=1 Tax=Pedobacter sp. ASV1-7 TaxID=3145237 RepID=UPI0032E8AA9E
MKLLLILAMLTLHTRASLYSQSRVTIELKNTTLSNVLKTIEQKTSYRFAYSNEVVPFKNLVSIDVKNAEISDVMVKLLEKLPLTFNVIKNIVVISANDKLNADNLSKALQIQGIVTDDQNIPLPGVNVKSQKHPSITAVTDSKGQFQITLPEPTDVLIFSYIGYHIQEQVYSFLIIPGGNPISIYFNLI